MIENLFFIKDGEISPNIEKAKSFQNVVAFCKLWLDGQESFTINTSGSTGTPKPINITRTQMEASAKMTAQALLLQSGGNSLVCLNTEYIAGKMMLVRGMVNDLNLYITEPTSNPLADLPKGLQIDFMAVVPLQMEAMIDQGYSVQLNKINAVIVGGAPISLTLEEKIKKLTCAVFATYGMTETVSHIGLKQLNGETASKYFQVLDGVNIDQDDRGCLTINSILTNHETIITNDIVDIIDNQTFEWLGRVDNVINSGGLKIHPEQLEDQISSILIGHRIDYNLIVVGIPDVSLGNKVVVVLETEYINEGELKIIMDVLKKSLPPHQSPKKIYTLKEFIYTETGKVMRSDTASLI